MTTPVDTYVSTSFFPLVAQTDKVLYVFRDPGATAVRPRLIITAHEPNTVVVITSGPDLNVLGFTLTETITIALAGQMISRDLPITGGATINKVTMLALTSGACAARCNSPIEFYSYVRQPYGDTPPA